MSKSQSKRTEKPDLTDAEAVEGLAEEVAAGAEAEPESTEIGLEDQLLQAQQEAREYLDGWQRARAELDNFRKRVDRERGQLKASLQGEVLRGLLPVLDDMDRAMANLPDDLKEHDWVGGMALVYRNFQKALADQGVAEIPALGEPFDPNVHEAAMQRPEEGAESGTVIEVLRKGYLIEDRVLRPAMVVVAG